MYRWIAGSTCAAAVLSLAVASAQTYPQTPDTTKQTPSTRSGQQTDTNRRGTQGTTTPSNRSAANTQRITVTGCLMQGPQSQSAGTRSANAGWILSNATMASGNTTASGQVSDNSTAGTSRSGSPSNEGTSADNRDGTAGIGVSGSTSTAVGTSGTNTSATGSIDTEVNGAGATGATDRNGSTVGAGATAGVTGNVSGDQSGTAQNNSGSSRDQQSTGTYGTGQTSGTSGTNTSASASGATTYQLTGVRNPMQYANKRVEVIGMMSNARNSGNQMLQVTSVRVVGDTCQ